jgi:hypothetical protein
VEIAGELGKETQKVLYNMLFNDFFLWYRVSVGLDPALYFHFFHPHSEILIKFSRPFRTLDTMPSLKPLLTDKSLASCYEFFVLGLPVPVLD